LAAGRFARVSGKRCGSRAGRAGDLAAV
jgi:hypothetical protein